MVTCGGVLSCERAYRFKRTKHPFLRGDGELDVDVPGNIVLPNNGHCGEVRSLKVSGLKR